MAGLKALLISSLIGAGGSMDRPPTVDQEHIWFNGLAAHVECNRTEKEIHFGQYTEYGGDKVSVIKTSNNGSVKRITQCIKFN